MIVWTETQRETASALDRWMVRVMSSLMPKYEQETTDEQTED